MIGIILVKELRGLLRWRRIFLTVVIAAIVMIYVPNEIFTRITGPDNIGARYIDFYFSFYSIIAVMILAHTANYTVFLRDKANGTLESLLAAPVHIRHVWLGKTLAVFLVGYTIAVVLSFAFVLVANHTFGPSIALVPSGYGYLSLFVLNPVICVLIIGLLGICTLLVRDYLVVRYGFFGIWFALFYFLKPAGRLIGVSVIPVQAAAILGLAILVFFALRLLTNERVVLSVE
ncbi:MAG: hypothetical protein JSV33_10870 [bacterium]|nr:MAG: hypothetical protein JSV33_10870 [bacterium]